MSTPTANAPISSEKGADQTSPAQVAVASTAQPAIESEMLIEEISIDGMCGVY